MSIFLQTKDSLVAMLQLFPSQLFSLFVGKVLSESTSSKAVNDAKSIVVRSLGGSAMPLESVDDFFDIMQKLSLIHI